MSIIKNILPAILAVALAAGCSGGDTDRRDGKLLVYASFYPMYDLASKAAGDAAEVRCLVPDGAEPHDWEPTPRDVAGLAEAKLFFYSGAGFEDWVPSVLSGLKDSGPRAADTSEGIELREGDPHVWLDPSNAKRQFETMCEVLKDTDPANAGAYEENLARWAPEFDKLDEEFMQLGELLNRHIVVAHEAFGYLCAAYGLEQLSASGYSPDNEPDPASMARLVDEARKYNVKVVFYEAAASVNTAEAIARELGVYTARLSPLEGLSDAERSNGGDYFSVMRGNLAALREALE